MTTSEAWRYQLRAEGVERRPAPSRPDRGYVEQPGEESKRPSLLIPISVLKDEEEKAIMAELLEEERLAKQAQEAAREREEDERMSGIRPALPPPPPPSTVQASPPPTRPRIIEKRDLRRSQEPLRAPLGDIAQFAQKAPDNETTDMAPQPAEPDDIDRQIQALLAKHEAAQKASESHPAPPKEHPTLLSRPEPPPPVEAPAPQAEDEWEDFHEAPTQAGPATSEVMFLGSDGRKYYSPEFRRATALEYIERRRAGESLTVRAFAATKGVGNSLLSRWLDTYYPDHNFKRPIPPKEPEMPTTASSNKQADGRRPRRNFTDHEKLDILDKIDQMQASGHSFKDACDEVDVTYNVIRGWQDARARKVLKRPPGRRPEAAANPKAPGPRATVIAAEPADDTNEERTVGVVMAELQAAKERVKQLKAELMELL